VSADWRSSRWLVSIDPHDVVRRFAVPAQTIEVVAPDGHAARVEAIRVAHRAAGVPADLPYAEHRSLQHARAVVIGGGAG
jgi:hypothetical protein